MGRNEMAAQLMQVAATALTPQKKASKSEGSQPRPTPKKKHNGDAAGSASEGEDQPVDSDVYEGKFFRGSFSRWHNRHDALPLEAYLEALHERNPEEFSFRRMMQHPQAGSSAHRDSLGQVFCQEFGLDPAGAVPAFVRKRPHLFFQGLRAGTKDSDGSSALPPLFAQTVPVGLFSSAPPPVAPTSAEVGSTGPAPTVVKARGAGGRRWNSGGSATDAGA